MKKRAVIHIGIDKTGSTTIQNALFSSRRALLSKAQILYPSIAANQSIHLMTLFRNPAPPELQMLEPRAIDETSIERIREQFRSSLEDDMANSRWNTLVISAEGLCDFYPQATADFVKWLSEYVDEMIVVAYVRHPIDWTRSVVQERLKQGATLDQLYKKVTHPNWRQRFDPWLNVVGKDNFKIVCFEEARKDKGTMTTFCDIANLPREVILPLTSSETAANESMSHEAISLLNSLNRQRPLFHEGSLSPERRWHGVDALMSIPGNRFSLEPEHEVRVREDSRPELEWLNSTFGTKYFLDIFENTTPEAVSRSETIPQETVDALAIMLSDFGNELQNLNEANEK